MKYRRKKTFSKIMSTILICFVAFGAVMAVTHLVNKPDDGRKIIRPVFAVGGLDDEGVYMDTDKTIYSKNAFECDELQVKLDFELRQV